MKKAIETGLYQDDDGINIQIWRSDWGAQKYITRVPLGEVDIARQIRNEIRTASAETVEATVLRWRAIARDLGGGARAAEKEGKHRDRAVQAESPLSKGENALLEAVRAAVETDKQHRAALEAVERAQTGLKQAELIATEAWKRVDEALLELRGQ